MLTERVIYVLIISALALGGIIWGLINTRRIIEAPCLYAIGMALILCPQLYPAASDPMRVPDQAFTIFNIMAILCSVSLYAGYFHRPNRPHIEEVLDKRWIIKGRPLYNLGLLFATVGVFGVYQLEVLGTVREWRGWPVYWVTLATLIVPGITLMLVAFFNLPKLWKLVPILLYSYFPLRSVFEGGRRAPTLTLPLIVLVPLLIYRRNLRVPRWTIVLALCGAFLVVYAFPVWRGSFKEHRYLETFRDNPPGAIIANLLSGKNGDHLEILDGMIVTGARFERGNYEFGASIYNMLVQNYVPGSLIGYERKNTYFVGKGISQDWVSEVYGIPVASYTAKSGYEDLFSQFSFFGCLIMYWIGRMFRRVHHAAIDELDGRAVIFLCFFISFPASLAYGSITYSLSLAIPQLLLMLLALKLCIRKVTFCRMRQVPQTVSSSIRNGRVLVRQSN
jgi:hypothetical protein